MRLQDRAQRHQLARPAVEGVRGDARECICLTEEPVPALLTLHGVTHLIPSYARGSWIALNKLTRDFTVAVFVIHERQVESRRPDPQAIQPDELRSWVAKTLNYPSR